MLSRKCNKTQYITSSLMIALMLASGATAAAETSSSPLVLAQASATVKQDGKFWIQKGDELRAAGKREEALQAYRKAESMGAGSDQLSFKIADTYTEMHRFREAYWEWEKVSHSSSRENRVEACVQMEWAKHSRSRSLPDPYFADLNTNVSWQEIGDVDVSTLDTLARVGMVVGEEKPAEYYLYAGYTKDNRSGLVGGIPIEYVDNLARWGVGFRKPITANHSLSFMAEVGQARDLIDKARDRTRDDFRGGFEYYKEWNKDYDCHSTNERPNRLFMGVYSELKYYSIYDDAVIFTLDLVPGIRLVETRKTDVDAFLLFSYNTNLEKTEDTYSEYAAGVTWLPDRQYNFTVTARVGEVLYKGGGSDKRILLELQHYIRW